MPTVTSLPFQVRLARKARLARKGQLVPLERKVRKALLARKGQLVPLERKVRQVRMVQTAKSLMRVKASHLMPRSRYQHGCNRMKISHCRVASVSVSAARPLWE